MLTKLFKIIFICSFILSYSSAAYADDLAGTYTSKEGKLIVTEIPMDSEIVSKIVADSYTNMKKDEIKAFYTLDYKLNRKYAKCNGKYSVYEAVYGNFHDLNPIDELNTHITGDRTEFIFALDVSGNKLSIIMTNARLKSPAGVCAGLVFQKK